MIKVATILAIVLFISTPAAAFRAVVGGRGLTGNTGVIIAPAIQQGFNSLLTKRI